MLKIYPLVFTFHFDVTIDNWKKGIKTINPYFYQMRLDELSAAYPNVDAWTDSTKKKVISVYTVMLTQAGFVNNKNLQVVMAPDLFWQYFIRNNYKWFLDACFLPNETKTRLQNLYL